MIMISKSRSSSQRNSNIFIDLGWAQRAEMLEGMSFFSLADHHFLFQSDGTVLFLRFPLAERASVAGLAGRGI